MHFFLLLMIPAATACILTTDSKYSLKQLSVPIFGGLFAGISTVLIMEFFSTSEFYPSASMIYITLHSAYTTIIPPIAITAIVFLLSKDDREYKAYSVLPALSFFYSVLIPYQTLTQGETTSFCTIFVFPVLYLETSLLYTSALKHILESIMLNDREKASLLAAATLGIMFIQPIFFSLWYLKIASPLCAAAALILMPASILFHKFSYKKKNSLDNIM